jgi:4a-hydroxytetrahydrobiopterin dehydratase
MSLANLADESCVPSRADSMPLAEDARVELLCLLEDWRVDTHDDVARLVRRFRFANFAEALAFTNAIGAIAESEDHHPVLLTEWGRVEVKLWTHVISGLHRNDFVMAAKCERAYAEMRPAER